MLKGFLSLLKMKFLFIWLLLPLTGFGQSLADTTTYGDSLYHIAESLFNNDYPTEETDKQSLKLYQEAIDTFQGDNTKYVLQADCYHKIGILYIDRQDYRGAISKFIQAIKIRNRQSPTVDSLHYMDFVYAGDAYYYISKIDSAEYCYRQAEVLVAKYPAIKRQDKLYSSMGTYYFSLGNYQQSSNYMRKALSIAEHSGRFDQYEQNILRHNIALTELKAGNYAFAISAFKLLAQNDPQPYTLFHNIGTAYKGQNQYDSAIYYLGQALPNQNYRTKNITLNNLGMVYTQLGNLDSANHYYTSSLALNDSLLVVLQK